MNDSYIVRQAQAKKDFSPYKTKWNNYQSWIKKFIDKNMEQTITQIEFENSWVWKQLLKNKTEVNAVMEYQQLSGLKITVDDKAKPLKARSKKMERL